MTTQKKIAVALSMGALLVAGCATFPDEAKTRQSAEKMVLDAFSFAPVHKKRLDQDESQRICSKYPGQQPTQQEAARVVQLARASIKYPEDGKLVGNWKVGDKLAHNGAGDRIRNGKLEKRKENGGLCQNCHGLAPGEVNVGNVGPSLTGFGKTRGNSEATAKYVYEKIYNAWAYYPCSNMPRLGTNNHLTIKQITDLVAFIVDPASPINK
jgi:sulfur-oxidizing protein SoxX